MEYPTRKNNNQTLAFNYSSETDPSRDLLLHTRKRKAEGGKCKTPFRNKKWEAEKRKKNSPYPCQMLTCHLHKYMIHIEREIKKIQYVLGNQSAGRET
jgi:hypothetical protein